MNNKRPVNLTEESYFSILQKESVTTLYHPIVSVKKKKIFGFEALSRGIDENGAIIPPDVLFSMASRTGTSLELDRLCRQRALESFIPLYRMNHEYLLSINVDSSILGISKGSNHLFNAVNKTGIDPSFIIIEILESDIQDIDALKDFVERYRNHNFLIAIDDIGSGFSNLERVILMKPDVIKIDRSLVDGIADNFYKQEVVKSIIAMAHGIGSVIVAEGVENENDAISCLEFGADYLQGFYFSRPDKVENLFSESMDLKISSAAEMFRKKCSDG